MKRCTWKPYVLWILLAEAVGALAGWLTRGGMEIFKAEVEKPPLTPPAIAFPIVWTVLFALMGWGMARVDLSRASAARSRGMLLFLVQLVFNFFWSVIFFHFQRYGLALAWLVVLWLLILWMALSFYKADRLAGWLQAPYLLWVAFAAYLNAGVWMLNR